MSMTTVTISRKSIITSLKKSTLPRDSPFLREIMAMENSRDKVIVLVNHRKVEGSEGASAKRNISMSQSLS